ncbi:MAG: hypothetical protein AAF682_04685 [Planctomycetota bacterium]
MKLPYAPAPALVVSLVLSAPSAGQEDGALVRTDEHGHSALASLEPAGVRVQTIAPKLGVEAEWTALGPFGGDVSDVQAKPGEENIVLAGLAPSGGGFGGTLYRSTDGGASWSEVADLAGTSVHDIEFASDGTAYAGTIDSPWRSDDGGATWTQLNLGIGANDQTFEITLDASSPGRIWAGVANATGLQTQTVLRSNNGGLSWLDVTPPFASPESCRGIAVDPGDSNHVFACFDGGFSGGSVWRTVNGGVSWTNVSAGLPGNPMQDLEFDGARLLVAGGKLFGSQFVGLYESLNNGTTWTPIHDGTWPSLVIQDIERDPANASTLLVASAGSGIFRSTDDGASWDFGYGGTDGLSVNEVSVTPSGAAPVFAGNSSVAVWRSDDGLTFAPSSAGIGSLNTVSVAANPLNADELAVAFQGLNDGGVYTSTNGGTTWELEPLPGTRFNTVGFAPNGTLYAISDGPTTIAVEGLYRRDPVSWTAIGPDQGPQFESELYALAFSESDPGLILTGGSDFGVAGAEATIWQTTNGGEIWNKAYEAVPANDEVRSLVILADGTDQIAVAAFDDASSAADGGVLRSVDSGASWADSSSGLPVGVQCRGLSASAFDPNLLYVADNDFGAGGLFRSFDGGQTWSSTGFAGRTFGVVADRLRPGRIFIAQSTAPLSSRSEDGGATFAPFDAGLGGAGTLNQLTVARGDCEALLLATGTGTYRRAASCELEADDAPLSASAGGSQALDLAAGPDAAGASYWVVGSATGTEPGTTLAGLTLPLVFDFYFLLSLTNPNQVPLVNSFATLDALGQGSAAFTVPAGSDPVFVGVTFYHAYATFLPGPVTVVLGASNAVSATIAP